jgi:hypothetical protein
MKTIPAKNIEGCCQCDSLDTYTNKEDWIIHRCQVKRKEVDDIDNIPAWCPLEDTPEPKQAPDSEGWWWMKRKNEKSQPICIFTQDNKLYPSWIHWDKTVKWVRAIAPDFGGE